MLDAALQMRGLDECAPHRIGRLTSGAEQLERTLAAARRVGDEPDFGFAACAEPAQQRVPRSNDLPVFEQTLTHDGLQGAAPLAEPDSAVLGVAWGAAAGSPVSFS
jgi:hypothetical protein